MTGAGLKTNGSVGRPGGWPRRVLAAITGQRLRPVWFAAVLGWLLFAVFRVGLLLARWDSLDDVGPREVLRCLWLGTWFDAFPMGYALLPLVLVLSLAPNGAFRRRWFRRMVVAYVGAVLTLLAGVEVAGAAFFLHFGVRLNWIAIDYIRFREAGAYVWNNYPVIWIVLTIGGLFYLCYRLFGRTFWSGARPRQRGWVRAVQALALSGLCALACRGSVGEEPRGQGSAYTCDNNLVNQLALNNVFTFVQAMKSRVKDSQDMAALYSLPPPSQAAEVATGLLLQNGDVPLGTPSNPLWRHSGLPAEPKGVNIVFIVMEGLSGPPVGALGHFPSQTPEFDALCQEGLFFERMYAVGERTSHGLVASLCGHPDLGRLTVLKRLRARGRFLTLPAIFHDRGYRTMFIYGGNPDFDNMRDFFRADGIENFVGLKQMSPGRLAGLWGAADEVIFRKAHELFLQAGDDRFFAVILTVSNHEPYDVPEGRVPALPGTDEQTRKLNAYRYADWALGEFFRLAQSAPYFERTIFVLVSDHGRDLDQRRILDAPGHHVPCLFYAPGIIPPRRVTTIGCQTDIPPTLLGLLGGGTEHCFLGRNLLEVADDDGFALLMEDDRIAFVREDYTLLLPPKRKPILFRTDPEAMDRAEMDPAARARARELQVQALSLYAMAQHLYLTSSYRRPAELPAPGG